MIKKIFFISLIAYSSLDGMSLPKNFSSIEVIERTAFASKVSLYWKDNSNKAFGSFPNLFAANKKLAYACNAGMYDGTIDRQPVGLYIENGKKLRPLKKVNNDKVNFGMQPQAVFLITKSNVAKVVSVAAYEKEKEGEVRIATQSAPMLVIDGKLNMRLTKSSSKYIRNGVGILKNGHILFLFTKLPVTFQQFAQLFIERGCVSAMYLDGAISNLLGSNSASEDNCLCYGPFIGVAK